MENKYVLGFYFSEWFEEVLLIKKKRPLWQYGKYNGVGGRIKEFESIYSAMVREFKEETGMYVPIKQWQYKFNLLGNEYTTVHIFYVIGNHIRDCRTITDEPICIFKTKNLPKNIIPNLSWIIPLIIDELVLYIPPIKFKEGK